MNVDARAYRKCVSSVDMRPASGAVCSDSAPIHLYYGNQISSIVLCKTPTDINSEINFAKIP